MKLYEIRMDVWLYSGKKKMFIIKNIIMIILFLKIHCFKQSKFNFLLLLFCLVGFISDTNFLLVFAENESSCK